jgi:Tol biopolymer transport system component
MVGIAVRRCVLLLLIGSLVACQARQSGIVPTNTSAVALPAMTTVTSTPIHTPLSESLPKFPLNGYVIAFIENGNLYYQNGDNQPEKLTHVGEAVGPPEISYDNNKILFSRENKNIYSINANGTDERIVIPSDWIISLKLEAKDIFWNYQFIPYTHKLLLETYACASREFRSLCATRLFIADTDTSEIKELADVGEAHQQNSQDENIVISPDGKMIAVGTMQGINIFTMDGNVLRKGILPYESVKPNLPWLSWLPDSRKMIVALPDGIYDAQGYDGVTGYSIRSYSVDDNVATQVPISPSKITKYFDISPDGKWIVYGGFSYWDADLYLSNLATGETQLFNQDVQPSFSWAPDSRHFAYGTGLQNIATIDNPTAYYNCSLIDWIDVSHFTCEIYSKDGNFIAVMAEINAEGIVIYDLGFDKNNARSISLKPE